MRNLEKILGYNSHSIGIIMKEIVRRVANAIREERFIFEKETKTGYDGNFNDLVTSADRKAQKIYIKLLQENFPNFGIIAEEKELIIQHKTKHKIYFTVDPLDGTKAFSRRQSQGVSTMISLVIEDEIIAVFIADINTQELFGFRPCSQNIWRIYQTGGCDKAVKLEICPDLSIAEQYILIRNKPKKHTKQSQIIIDLFKNITVVNGSIGTSFSLLWKSEVGGLLLEKNYETPWDSNPVIGISKKMGFRFFRIDKNKIMEINFPPVEKMMNNKSSRRLLRSFPPFSD